MRLTRSILLALALGLAVSCAQAQTKKPKTTSTPPAPSPAQMGVTPTTNPETLKVLDKNKNWATMGSIVDGVFIPVGGGAGPHTNVVASCGTVTLTAGLHTFGTQDTHGVTCSTVGTEGGGGGPIGASCPASSAFLARTSGLSAKETAAYGNMICGMVTDGTWSLLDVLYIFPTNNSATASLNLTSASYTGSINGTLGPFTRDEGWAPTGAGDFDTGYDPSIAADPQYSLNSAQIGVYILSSRTTGNGSYNMGVAATGTAALSTLFDSSGTQGDINSSTYSLVYAATDTRGSWLLDRTSSSEITYYRNETLVATIPDASDAIPQAPFFVFSINLGSSGTDHTADKVAAAWVGKGATPTQAAAIQSRINGYMTELSINVY